ncbi:hypothetical protein J2Z35_000722 [Acetoanaerobium pronyense]|uniref:DUF871 domain-containing protein n=1 Tax=Acetoanaerobium pronyense TaxID=1482736 RepID=A0ABS4KGP8_9FIRM|nr:MupG family TIM beta-alpha barrel fold protein [Acetoanaerobium pronyense]MBP2026930.1 hypothetical protein [Acetoanaerobium pronyense]
MFGISIYTGMDYSLEDNLKYLENAKKYGIDTVFTSLHIPEAQERLYEETKEILKKTKELDMKIIADISKGFMEKIEIKDYNIHSLRLDFGFSIEEITDLTKNKEFKIQINASTIDEAYLKELIEKGADLENIEVGHNYYPRKDTGISYTLLKERNSVFKKYGFSIMAFVSSLNERRGPIYEGLPTLESTREIRPLLSAQYLLNAGVDIVIIGDAFASDKEINDMTKIKKDIWTIPLKAENITKEEMDVLSGVHTNRMDPGEFTIRSQEARLKKTSSIKKRNTGERLKYFLTIDNEGYLRYERELQIVMKNLPSDDRINIIGDLSESSLLINQIKPGDKFEFLID